MRLARFILIYLLLSAALWFATIRIASLCSVATTSGYEVSVYAEQGTSLSYSYLDKELTSPVSVSTKASTVYVFTTENKYLDSNKGETENLFVRDFTLRPGQQIDLTKSGSTVMVVLKADRPIEVTSVHPIGSLFTGSVMVIFLGLVIFVLFTGGYWSQY